MKDKKIVKILKKIYKNTFKMVFPSAGEIVDKLLINELKDCSKIIDLGCGASSPLGRIKHKLKPGAYLLGVDDFAPYIEISKKNNIHDEYTKENIFAVEFPEKSFDCAIMLDVIEHFEKEDFLKFLPKLEKIAKKIIVMTPNGFVKQEKYDNNEYQLHKSGWTSEDLANLGFKVYGVSGLKYLRGELALPVIKPALIGNMIANITEPLVFNNPSKAYHLVCIKTNRN